MKIALIGNMNNNNFVLMRYFRDLGADAHLLLYSNDGKGTLSHFRPEDDTFEIERWAPYIHQTRIANAPVSALPFPVNKLHSIYSYGRQLMGLQDEYVVAVSKQKIEQSVAGYDFIIGTGIAPAALHRINKRVDIFVPYASGIEFFKSPGYADNLKHWIYPRYWLTREVMKAQAAGIKLARHVCTVDAGTTFDVLNELKIRPQPLATPMVYVNQAFPQIWRERRMDIDKIISDTDFSVMMHCRLAWNEADGFVEVRSKNNHWLLYAFKQLVKLRPNIRPLLILFEYGPHIRATKRLVKQLDLEEVVRWLPKSPRNEILRLLTKVDIGVGEFIMRHGTIWGGTGWEVLASGKPVLQGFNFEHEEFEQIYGYPTPPMLPVRKQDDILTHLLDMADHPNKREEIGQAAREWFNRYNGIGLAERWLDLLMTLRTSEGDARKTPLRRRVHV